MLQSVKMQRSCNQGGSLRVEALAVWSRTNRFRGCGVVEYSGYVPHCGQHGIDSMGAGSDSVLHVALKVDKDPTNLY